MAGENPVGARALLVDDNEISLLMARSILSHHGLSVTTAPDGISALDRARETDFDIIFMDHIMPDMDGIETAAAIRKLGGKYAAVPIIALTANESPGIKDFFVDKGMSDYLSKPLEDNSLGEALLRWIGLGEPGLQPHPAHTAEPPLKSEVLRRASEHSGLEISSTLRQIGGDEDVYLRILQTFMGSVSSTLDILPAYVSEGRWDDLRIRIHGERGGLANIGAASLAEAARLLELAAINRDIPYIKNNIGAFCGELKLLHKRLEESIPARETVKKAAATDAQRAALKSDASAVLGYIENLEGGLALGLMEEITSRSYGGDLDAVLEKIRRCIEDFDYDTAEELLTGVAGQI
ncbi:MAG: response regulator [Oscillospiraceae bacterium]|nr:response regulator [Oscillospiraceae bacterium]